MERPFGEDLWRHARAVRLDRDGTLRAPVRITEEDGLVVGVDRVGQADARRPASPSGRRHGLLSRLLRRRPRR